MGYRLYDGVRVEPDVFGWPAWWCNVAPAAAALHACRSQLPALRSYVRNPAAHARAASDPKLAGGAFVGVPPERADEVRRLLEAMAAEYAEDCAFAEAWASLGERLRASAQGQSLEAAYADVPAELGGLVELGYDYDNRPSVRLDEGFAYATGLYKPGRQGVVLCDGSPFDRRPFYASTPNVATSGLRVRTPFKAAALREMLDLDLRPAPDLGRAEALLRALVPAGAPGEARRWFADAPPLAEPPWAERRVRVRYVGHACLLVQHDGFSVLVDPLVPQGRHGAGVFGFESLPERVDVVLVTHAHPDHFDLETLLRLRARAGKVIVPRHGGLLLGDVSLQRVLREMGYADVEELAAGDRLELPSGELVALPFLGEHGDVLHGAKATYWLRLGGVTLLAAADSTCLDPKVYERARALVGRVDHVFMNVEVDGAPIGWPFDALLPKRRDRGLESSRRCRGSNVEEGLRLLRA
ncbi:MAG TPA: MBL fold metallo-hydrolase, partial [Polyangiaceae bacterium]|nr:MBL fold metallo-hydrolase [Polyangiaceae bacterium]